MVMPDAMDAVEVDEPDLSSDEYVIFTGTVPVYWYHFTDA